MRGFLDVRFASMAIMVIALTSMGVQASLFPSTESSHESTASPEDSAVWVSRPRGVAKISPETGQLLHELPFSLLSSMIEVDGEHRTIWTYGQNFLHGYDFDGNWHTQKLIPQLSLSNKKAMAVDPTTGDVLIALYKTLHRYNANGQRLFSLSLPSPVKGLDIDRQTGAAWYLHNSGLLSINRQGESSLQLSLSNNNQALLRDGAQQQSWIASSNTVSRYDDAGELLSSHDIAGIQFIAAPSEGPKSALWLASEQRLYHLSQGEITLDVDPFQSSWGSDKVVAMAPDNTDGSVWVAGQFTVVQIDQNGAVLQSIPVLQLQSLGPLLALAHYGEANKPELAIMVPEQDALVAQSYPEIILQYSATGAGPDLASLDVQINQQEWMLACESVDTQEPVDYRLECLPQQALPEGENILRISIADQDGNRSDIAETSFTVDTLVPEIAITQPQDGLWTNESEQNLQGTVSETVSLTLNGQPLALDDTLAFSQSLLLGEGSNTFELVAEDPAGNQSARNITLNLDTQAPALPEEGAITVSAPDENGDVTVSAGPGTAEPGTTIEVTNQNTGETQTVTVAADGRFALRIAAASGDPLTVRVVDQAGNASESRQSEVPEPADGDLPPDPATVAPELDPTVVTSLRDATEFLYTGTNPIQQGVAPGTIEEQRAAVIRGRVNTRNGLPLTGVTITIQNADQYGHTLSRSDGAFDMAVNGGGTTTVNYEKEGYLPVQRQINVPWQDYVWLPDVVMIPVDNQVTTVTLDGNASMQVAQGSSVTDDDGTRTAAVLFPEGTTAEMLLPDGSTQPLSTLNVRATEYTVGDNGPKAMPGELPPASGYTYAVELSVDEAMAAGAKEVRFNQPVPFYVENFLGFPVGGAVPTGWYDRDKAAWIPSDNGRVIKVLAINNGLAELDVDGSGNAADQTALAELAIDDAERQKLAEMYEAGQSLWRVPIPHFTPWDHNWPYGPPEDAVPPPEEPPEPDPQEPDPCEKSGSIIECQNQVLRQSIPVTGTPFNLNYSGDRVPGRKAARVIDVPLSNGSIPPSLKKIVLRIEIAGRNFSWSFSARANLFHKFEWDGFDSFGREVVGNAQADIKIGYVYDAVYYEPSEFGRAFSNAGGGPISRNTSTGRATVTLWRESLVTIKGMAFSSFSKGVGLSVHGHYFYDSSILYKGGFERHVNAFGEVMAEADYPANYMFDLAVGPDGDVYYSKQGSSCVVGVADEERECYLGSAGGDVAGFDFDYYGNLYFIIYGKNQVWKMAPDGVVDLVAGSGERGFSGDFGPAAEAKLNEPYDIEVGYDGSVYILDRGNYRVRKVGPDGIIRTVAGNGVKGDGGDGGSAVNAELGFSYGIALDSYGNIYYSDLQNSKVRKVDVNGVISTVAGGGSEVNGDGLAATDVRLSGIRKLAVGHDGSLYIAERNTYSIRKVGPDGIIGTVAGNGWWGSWTETVDGALAVAESLDNPYAVAVSNDGDIYLSNSKKILRVFSQYGARKDVMVVPSEEGDEIYEFSMNGQHLRTLSASTGEILYLFRYDNEGFLAETEDADGNITRVERDSEGNPLAIIAPEGQRTELTLDANGYLASVTNPAGESHEMTYTEDGLMTRFQYPHGHASTYTYDDLGRLQTARNAEGGGWDLARADLEGAKGYLSSMTSQEGRTTTYKVEHLPTGATQRTNSFPDGTQSVSESRGGITTLTAPDGTVTQRKEGPDPRFGMAAPVPEEMTITTPAGLVSNLLTTRNADLADEDDLMSHTSLSETRTVNGRTSTTSYDAASRTWTRQSPAGRVAETEMDDVGHPVSTTVTGLNPVSFAYDEKGRLTSMATGEGTDERRSIMNYDAQGNLDSLTDALQRTTSFEHDLAGRIIKQILPDGREVNYAYDPNGNLISLTPPGRDAHVFTYDGIDQESAYTPPEVAEGQTVTHYAYSLDGDLSAIERPDGKTVSLTYNTGGQLTGTTLQRGQLGYSYHPDTGKLTQISTPEGNTLTYDWDGFLPLRQSWQGEVNGTVNQQWDNNFWLTQRCVNSTSCVSFSYDDDGLLTQAGDLTLMRNADNGLLDGSTLGDLSHSYDYNAFGERTATSIAQAGNTLGSMAYQHDKVGRITSRSETLPGSSLTDSYQYDDAGRLVSATRNGQTTTWQYDANGNRTHENGVQIATYDEQDRLLGYQGATYTHTKNGERQSKTESGSTTTYEYDELGNLLTVTLPGDMTIEYVIDGQNRRIGKKVNGTLTQGFLYKDQLNPIAELDGSGNISARFIYGDKANVPAYMVKGGKTYRIISDHLGSPRIVIDTATGDVVQRVAYDVWGNITEDTNPGFQPFGFAGGIYDQHTGLVRFGVRDYDPQVGRWTVKDPIRFNGDGPNLYGYVQGNPVSFSDPMGLASLSYDFSRGAGIGVTIGLDNSTGKPFISLRGQLGNGLGFAFDLEDNGPFDRELMEGPYGPMCPVAPNMDNGGNSAGAFLQVGGSLGPWNLGYGAEGGEHFNNDGSTQSYSDFGPDVTTNAFGAGGPVSLSAGGTFGVEVGAW